MDDDLGRLILAELRQQTTLLAHLAARVRPPRQRDRAAGTELLPALASHFDGVFGAREVLHFVGVDLPTRRLLRLALEAAVGELDATAGRRLGHLLRRLAEARADFGGWSVERVGEDSAGAVWLLRPTKVTETHTSA
jgi:hypothetical protein